MQHVKQLLEDHNISQRNLASHLGISPASVSLILNHNQFPKSPNKSVIIGGINQFFSNHGIKFKHKPQSQSLTQEDELMLLRKQTLTQQARKQFKLFTNPFTSDIRSADELYQSADIAYVRTAMMHTAKHGGFIAVTGESGAGKTTLKRDLIDRLKRENQSVIAIEPYVLAAEDNDVKGKTLKAVHIAEAILNALLPLATPKRSPEARFRQIHNALKESFKAGNRHVLIIEEAHSLPIPTLKHLKRFFELEDGYDKLLGIILIGQNELSLKLSEQNPSIREVVQRCEIVTLEPITPSELPSYIAHRLKNQSDINSIIDDSGINAIVSRLVRTDNKGKVMQSLLYPLAIGNLLTGAMNKAAELGVPVINADLIMNV